MRSLLLIFLFAAGFIYFWSHPSAFRDALSSNQRNEQQSSLERFTNVSMRIDKILQETIKKVPSAARIRVAFVHVVPTTSELRYNITNATTVEGHPVGELSADHSISEWSAYFSKLLNGQCADVNVENVTSSISRARLNSLQIRRFLTCPINNDHRQFLGAAFMSWDYDDPDPPNMADAETVMRQAASEIGRENQE